MTDKEKHIVEFLKSKGYKSYYIDIREKVGVMFDSEEDFDYNLNSLKRKNWIYENELGDTLYLLNSDMLRTIDFKIFIDKFKVISTGTDGGHKYISTEIDFNGKRHKLTAFFLNKADENRLEIMTKIMICGDLMDEGEKYDLVLLNSEIINQ